MQLPISKLIVVGNKADTVYRTEPYGPMFAKKSMRAIRLPVQKLDRELGFFLEVGDKCFKFSATPTSN